MINGIDGVKSSSKKRISNSKNVKTVDEPSTSKEISKISFNLNSKNLILDDETSEDEDFNSKIGSAVKNNTQRNESLTDFSLSSNPLSSTRIQQFEVPTASSIKFDVQPPVSDHFFILLSYVITCIIIFLLKSSQLEAFKLEVRKELETINQKCDFILEMVDAIRKSLIQVDKAKSSTSDFVNDPVQDKSKFKKIENNLLAFNLSPVSCSEEFRNWRTKVVSHL